MTKSNGDPAIDIEQKELSASGKDDGTRDAATYRRPSLSGHSLQPRSQRPKQGQDDDRNEALPPPNVASEGLDRWNSSKLNVYKLCCTFWAFFFMGCNDSTYGVILPSVERYYNISYIVVSTGFLSPVVGFNLAVLLNDTVALRLGQRGAAFLTPVCHLIGYITVSMHPPFPVIPIVFVFCGLGNAFAVSAWNSWIGNMANANEVLGFLHASYGCGALVAPLVATSMIVKAGLPWYTWYYCLIGLAVIGLVTSVHAFWASTGAVFRASHPRTTTENGSRLREAVSRRPAALVTWLMALFILCYVGTEVAIGGWTVTFMLRRRDASEFASGMTATGFWLGLTIGRVVLGFVTPKFGERLAVNIYLPAAMVMQLLVWLVPNFYVGAVAVALVGFFIGPLFPAAVVVMTKLLPRHLHISSIGFSMAFGGSGGAIFPFAVGAIAQAKGVQVLQPFVLALLAACLMLWLALPKAPQKPA